MSAVAASTDGAGAGEAGTAALGAGEAAGCGMGGAPPHAASSAASPTVVVRRSEMGIVDYLVTCGVAAGGVAGGCAAAGAAPAAPTGFGAGPEPTGRYTYVARVRSAFSEPLPLARPLSFQSVRFTTRGRPATRPRNVPRS